MISLLQFIVISTYYTVIYFSSLLCVCIYMYIFVILISPNLELQYLILICTNCNLSGFITIYFHIYFPLTPTITIVNFPFIISNVN